MNPHETKKIPRIKPNKNPIDRSITVGGSIFNRLMSQRLEKLPNKKLIKLITPPIIQLSPGTLGT